MESYPGIGGAILFLPVVAVLAWALGEIRSKIDRLLRRNGRTH